MSQIVVLDYGIGNIRSITNALIAVGAQAVVSADRPVIDAAAGLIIPGVGAFAHGMANLEERGLVEPVLAYARSGRPVLGICLGMQLLMESSDEHGSTKGLGLIEGDVSMLQVDEGGAHRLPHVMWNTLTEVAPGPDEETLRPADQGKYFYFVHSYAARPRDRSQILASTRYAGRSFCAALRHRNIVGVQFHPEKSGADGLALLQRFVQTCR